MRDKNILVVAFLGLFLVTLGIGFGGFTLNKFGLNNIISGVNGNTEIKTMDTTIICNETFTSTPLGSLPSGWTDFSIGSSVCSIVDFGGNNVLMLDDADGSSVARVNYSLSYPLARGVLEYKLRFTNDYTNLLIKNSSGIKIWQIYTAYDGELCYLWGFDGHTGYYMTDNTWYDLKVVFDINNGLDVYVNNELKIENYLPRADGNVCQVSFESIWSPVSDTYIDDVLLYVEPLGNNIAGFDIIIASFAIAIVFVVFSSLIRSRRIAPLPLPSK